MRIIEEKIELEKYLRSIAFTDYREIEEIEEKVKKIITDVIFRKDEAILEYTRLFDCKEIEFVDLTVKEDEIERAYLECQEEEPEFIEALKIAYENIYQYHLRQKEETWLYVKGDTILGQIIRPLEKVGIYVPGGNGSYPSTVLMNSIPAKIAGVKEIIMVTPPDKHKKINKYTLAAAKICGINKIFKVGGAQAIAALAIGTQLIPRVDKIVGPGNIYVAIAKKVLFGVVDIDSVAGPSEVLVIADSSANPKYVAADLLSQAEHDTRAKSILITTSKELAFEVVENINEMLKTNPNPIAFQSIEKNGVVIIVEDLEEAASISNIICPEHLELCCKNPEELIFKIKNAGAIFVGEFSPEPIGDYIAGPNHVLPTSGTARFFSPLGVYDFVKRVSVIKYSKDQFFKDAPLAIEVAQKEGFSFHANSLKVRLEDVQK
ncbi:histidinol dehydrogenase [Caldicellulosiruptor morganii]|uniref:Histidinol dehydrogenase n=1 Tax=Caldicellulosiruptor morganii TaxID=1387555 RepID=A0ABY7BQV5_9FIRM|nr:histidinol dehydrogenase [Caldicellulosiruptor morganii]WAM34828.1 histidinol dehydrogenase [Caldicellulosiruptor morganii]